MGLTTKRYFYKIYTSSGTYVKTLKDVVERQPVFSMAINEGVGELRLNIARTWKDLEGALDIVLYNELKVYVSDKENSSLQIYSGYLNAIKRKKDGLGQEFIECQFLGYVSEMAVRVLEFNSGYTALSYNSAEPGDILKSIIDLYAGKITYGASSISATSNTVSLTYNVNTIREAIDRMLTTCPIGWYWFVDGTNTIYLRRTDKETIDHRLYIGKHISEIEIGETMESVKNDIMVLGGTPDGENRLYKRYYNPPSQTQFGKRTEVKNDGRLYNEGSMDFIGQYLLGTQYAKEYNFRFRVFDSNYTPKGYDIESIQPGDVIKINDPKATNADTLWDIALWDVDYWDYNVENPFSDPLIVEEIKYYGTEVEIVASRLLRGIGFRLADVKRNLENFLNAQTPVTPSESTPTNFTYDSNGDLVAS